MAAAAIRIVDETPAGVVLREASLYLASEKLTVGELLERRVRQEVESFNAQSEARLFQGLVQPIGAEAGLNGYRLRERAPIDAQAQCALARDSFEARRLLLLVDRRQATALDEEIVVTPATTVSFIKLVPLVGG